jgi:pimeloyl-ACP methyl ester carboxylesterase
MERSHIDVAGRRVDYLEFGDPNGMPALHLHGSPSSGAAGAWLDTAARTHGVRIVSPDRPGYLGSELAADSSLLGTTRHLLAFARALGLGRFGVAAFSAGASYALALAWLAPDEVTVTHVGGGVGPLAQTGTDVLGRGRRLLFRAATTPLVSPVVLGGSMGLLRVIVRRRFAESPAAAAQELYLDPSRGTQVDAVAAYIRDLPPQQLREEIADHIAATACRAGILNDLRAYVRPWPFELRDVTAPVEVWHGLADPAVPAGFARAAGSQLQNGNVHLLDGEGHFVFHTHADEIAASLQAYATTA